MNKKKVVLCGILFVILMLFTTPIYRNYTKTYRENSTAITTEINADKVKNTGLILKDNPVKQKIKLGDNSVLLSKMGLFFGTYQRKNLGTVRVKIMDEETYQVLANENIDMTQLEDNQYFYLPTSSEVLTRSIIIETTSEGKDPNNAVTLWTNAEENISVEVTYFKAPMTKSKITLIWALLSVVIILCLKGIVNGVKGYIQLITGLKQHINNFAKYKTLLKELVVKELKLKYKRSVLGFLWSVLNPLLMMCIMTLVFSTLFESDIQNFPIYLILGQTIFTFFSEATNGAMGSVVSNSSLINKVYIPKYIFPMSKIIFALCNFLFSMAAVIIVMIFTRVSITGAVIMFPIGLIYLSMFSLGIGLVLAAYGVFFRDITHLYGVLILAWTYLTPIFYPTSILPENVLPIVQANPMTHFINYFRQVVMYGQIPSLSANIVCFVYGIVALIIGVVIFYKKQDKFILYI